LARGEEGDKEEEESEARKPSLMPPKTGKKVNKEEKEEEGELLLLLLSSLFGVGKERRRDLKRSREEGERIGAKRESKEAEGEGEANVCSNFSLSGLAGIEEIKPRANRVSKTGSERGRGPEEEAEEEERRQEKEFKPSTHTKAPSV
jgi:hypothetical protein